MATATFKSISTTSISDSTGQQFTVVVEMDEAAFQSAGYNFYFDKLHGTITATNQGTTQNGSLYDVTFSIIIDAAYAYGSGYDGTLTFESVDSSNNVIASCTTTIHVNDITPKVNASIPSPVTTGNNFTATISMVDQSTVASATYTPDCVSGTWTISPLTNFSVTLTSPTITSSTYYAPSVTITPKSGYGTTKTVKFSQRVDEKPPVITFSAPASVNEGKPFAVSASATSTATVDHIDVTFNGVTSTISSNSGSVSLTAPSTSGSNKLYNLNITAYDKHTAPDWGIYYITSSKTTTVNVIESVPTVSITSVPSSVSESTPSNPSTFSVSVSASDDSGIDHTDITFNGTTKTVSGTSGSVSFTAPSTSGSNSSATISAKTYAKDGGTATASKTITITEIVPTVSITSIPSSIIETTPSNTSTFNVTVSASDDSGIDHINVSISGSSATVNGSSGTATLTAPSVNGSNTPFTVTATAHSKDGGTATATASITVTESAPTVSITSLPSSVNESTPSNSSTFSVSASASDDSGIDHITVSISGSSANISGGSGSATLTAPSTSGSNATYTVTATAYANDGGTASTSHSITVIERGASVTVNSCPSSVGEGKTFSVKASGSDDSGIDHISYTFNGTTKTGSSGSYVSFTAPRTSGSNKNYTMTITAHANDGNTATTSRTITVVESQASITSCTYKDKARSGGKLDITVNATDDSGIDHIEIDYHGTIYTGSNNTPITIKCIRTNKKITDSFMAKAVASDGNSVSATYSFILLPGMSLDKLFVARYIGLDATRIIFGGGPMVMLGKKLIGSGRLI